MKRIQDRYVFPLITVILLGGTTVMYWLIYALPVSDGSIWSYIAYTLFLIVLGLTIPYWVLKLGMHSAHLRNKDEKEMNLEDIPKDKQDLGAKGF